MADFGAIFSVIESGSALALRLYKLPVKTVNAKGANITQAAHAINGFSSAVKQIGTFIREEDTLVSPEAVETLEDVLSQGEVVLKEISGIILENEGNDEQPEKLAAADSRRLLYLQAHMEALRCTVAVLQQTLYTAQGKLWARGRPFISPQQAAAAVRNEKTQLEVAVIEQQLAIISAFRAYESSNPEARLLMEKDSAESLVTRKDNAKPADLYRYQGQSMANMDFLETSGEQFYSSVCKISDAYREDLLDRWTRLRQVEESMGYEQKQKRDTQQPTVETDSEEDADRAPAVKAHTGGAFNPAPLDTMYDYTAPLSPTSSYGASPRSSLNSFASQAPWPPMSPAPNPPSTPIKAAAAVEARDTDDEGNLEIPWTLCTRKYHWRYIDDKLKDSNTDMLSSEAYKDRNSWTEILATWVCKEAIKEQGYDYTQVQKERRVGRQTKFETCFCIQQALTFEQVRSLVERTVEIYRASQTETPPLSRRRSSSYAQSQLPTPPRPMPVARNTLDRTASLPAKTPPNLSIPNWNRHPSTPPNSYPPHPSTSFPPQYNQHPPWAPYPSPSSIPYYPPNTGPVRLPPNNPAPLHPKRRHNSVSKMDYLDVSSTSDSDDTAYQKRRSRSRRSSASSQKKKKKHSTVGTLAKVGGLVTLLDGIADLGVL